MRGRLKFPRIEGGSNPLMRAPLTKGMKGRKVVTNREKKKPVNSN